MCRACVSAGADACMDAQTQTMYITYVTCARICTYKHPTMQSPVPGASAGAAAVAVAAVAVAAIGAGASGASGIYTHK